MASANTEPNRSEASRTRRMLVQGLELGNVAFWTIFVVFVVLNDLKWITSPPAALALLLLLWTAMLWGKYAVAPAETRRMKWFYLACGLITSVTAVLYVITILVRQVR